VWGRLRKIWLRLVLGVSLTAAAVAHFDTVKALENTSLAKLAEEFRKAPDDSAVAFGLGGLAGAFFLLQAARRGLQSFGIDAGALLPGVTSQTNLSALDAKASFRLTFATQFREVTAALNPRTLVVFIDDLDRCRPENVLEVMESINFLSSSGDCFIVLGMDWDYVLRSVALGFEKVADAMSDAVPGADDVRSKRLAFAKSYLEKLVNFDIPVPTPDAAKREEFLLPKAAAVAPAPPPRRFDFPAWTARLTTLAMLAALIAVPLAVYSWAKPRPGPSAAFAGAVAPVGPVTVGTDGRNTKQPSPPPNAPTTFAPSPPQSSTILLWGALGVTGVLIGVGVVGLLRNPGVVVRDSGAFTRALGLWIGPITARRHTARSLKQFINRLRYCAARMRVEGAEPSRWERLLWALGVRSRPGPSARQSSQEADLVQWSVLNEVCPAALDGTAPVPDDVAELVARHASLFARPADEREQERRYFRHLAAGFRTDTGRSSSDRAAPDS
jgi:KAP family P-loop domain